MIVSDLLIKIWQFESAIVTLITSFLIRVHLSKCVSKLNPFIEIVVFPEIGPDLGSNPYISGGQCFRA
jgi:hypothetical protein